MLIQKCQSAGFEALKLLNVGSGSSVIHYNVSQRPGEYSLSFLACSFAIFPEAHAPIVCVVY